MKRKFTNTQLAECAKREVAKRKKVYPRLVTEKKMTQTNADLQIQMMQEIADCFSPQPLNTLFNVNEI